MKSYRLEDILAYMACPFKLKLAREAGQRYVSFPAQSDDKNVLYSALRDTYIFYFQRRGMQKELHTKYLTRFFSKRCVEYKKLLKSNSKFIVNDPSLLINVHGKVLNIPSFVNAEDEVIASNFPIERRIRDIIVTDTVDLLVLRRPKKRESYTEALYISGSSAINDETSYELSLRAYFGHGIIWRDLCYTGIKLKSRILNVYTEEDRIVDIRHRNQMNYIFAIRKVAKSIEQEIFYPRQCLEACKSCVFSKICRWKIE